MTVLSALSVDDLVSGPGGLRLSAEGDVVTVHLGAAYASLASAIRTGLLIGSANGSDRVLTENQANWLRAGDAWSRSVGRCDTFGCRGFATAGTKCGDHRVNEVRP